MHFDVRFLHRGSHVLVFLDHGLVVQADYSHAPSVHDGLL